MGSAARLDVVEYASEAGGPASYDVSVVTPLRDDARFVESCARSPGHAAALRHREKLQQQYPHRLPGSQLIPLVAECGGRWHSSVPKLARLLARAYVRRTPALPGSAAARVVSRWAARLSALVLRGNAAVFRHAQPEWLFVARGAAGDVSVSGLLPEGESVYELLVT